MELFPHAKFIYLHRSPEIVRKSMEKIWHQEIIRYFCLQKLDKNSILSQISNTQSLLTKTYDRDKERIPASNLIEIPYDEFIRSPFLFIESIYHQFNFDFDEGVKQALMERIRMQESYRESVYT